MKNKMLIALIISIILMMCLTSCFRNVSKNVDLGERYDSDKIGQWVGYANTDEFGELLENYFKDASETQFAVHEETAIAIAEAVIKEIYPDEGYHVVRMSSYQKAIYYEAENCWEVWLRKRPSRLGAILVYVDVNIAAVRAIIPQNAFG